MSIQSINPTTEEVIETFEPYSDAQVEQALNDARRAFLSWRETSFAERGALFHRLAQYLRAHKAELGRLAPGFRADMVALDPDNVEVLETWVAGLSE